MQRRPASARAPYKGRLGCDKCKQLLAEAATCKRATDWERDTHRKTACGQKHRSTGACHRASRPWTRRLLATRSTVTCVG
ncbi:hypothetical protein B296_00030224 [Ensete ventricosum]|uniref:Uncharacterized protein n=1 Tax=Ensete ventricosum TaxID=4639 RepID=A0A426XGG6_ENSVE|nr:hypothetical protein B296_00030224 [Ensete ventricosum]